MSYKEEKPGVVAGETDSPSSGPLGEDANRLLREFRQMVHDHLELATLEARLSINAMLRMAIISIITAMVLVSAWLALVGSAAMGLVDLGLPPSLALFFVSATSFLLAMLGRQRIRKLSLWLGWPATQRVLKRSFDDEKQAGDK